MSEQSSTLGDQILISSQAVAFDQGQASHAQIFDGTSSLGAVGKCDSTVCQSHPPLNSAEYQYGIDLRSNFISSPVHPFQNAQTFGVVEKLPPLEKNVFDTTDDLCHHFLGSSGYPLGIKIFCRPPESKDDLKGPPVGNILWERSSNTFRPFLQGHEGVATPP